MIDTVSDSSVEGNTKPQPKVTKRRGWCFTWNNYTEEDWEQIKKYVDTQTQYYIVGKEEGKLNNTPHLQGYIYYANARTFKQVKDMLPKCHIEPSRGTPIQNHNYCSKEGEYIERWNQCKNKQSVAEFIAERKKIALNKYKSTVWKQWQADIIAKLDAKADDRSIIWVVDEKGHCGKSYLAKYLYLKHATIIADGHKSDIFNQLNIKINIERQDITLCILDIPRCGEHYINYGVIEQLKNGLIYSGKYEGGDIIFDPLHIIIFANFEPDYYKVTSDRWNIIEVKDQE